MLILKRYVTLNKLKFCLPKLSLDHVFIISFENRSGLNAALLPQSRKTDNTTVLPKRLSAGFKRKFFFSDIVNAIKMKEKRLPSISQRKKNNSEFLEGFFFFGSFPPLFRTIYYI